MALITSASRNYKTYPLCSAAFQVPLLISLRRLGAVELRANKMLKYDIEEIDFKFLEDEHEYLTLAKQKKIVNLNQEMVLAQMEGRHWDAKTLKDAITFITGDYDDYSNSKAEDYGM